MENNEKKYVAGVFTSVTDHLPITYYKFEPEQSPKIVLQIAHGMAEKALRYQKLAEIFQQNGIGVYLNDHRGHGASAHKDYGYMGKGDVFLKMVRDVKSVTDIIHRDHPDAKVVFLGHSMGSAIAQRYIQIYYDEIDAAILAGSFGKEMMLTSKFGKLASGITMKLFGPEKKSNLIGKGQNKLLNQKIHSHRTTVDWISTDSKEVDKFVQAPDLGFTFSSSAYHYFFQGVEGNFLPSAVARIPKDFPLLIIAGDQDPVGDLGKGPKNLYQMYTEAGMHNVTLKLYEGKRHELFNETNRQEVIAYIQKFMECINEETVEH